ncbi:MAG: hypothetical protein FWD57_08160, partial [Polyangiaceae bacterium]|nr:hypothetical protein [Polyangiaceae bacterium]
MGQRVSIVLCVIALIATGNLGACKLGPSCSGADDGDELAAQTSSRTDLSRVSPFGPPPARIAELLAIEDTRTISSVMESDLANADPRVRRAATRAVARAEDPAELDRLLKSLADEDPDVLSWAAFGLGRICARDKQRIVQRLAVRAMNYRMDPKATVTNLDPWRALAGAMGKCASTESEKTLVAWLSGPKDRAIAATVGLGSVVNTNRRMEEETATALLRATRGYVSKDLAQNLTKNLAMEGSNDPITDALFPFGRLKRAPARVETQLLSACKKRLDKDGPSRVFVMRALGTLGDDAVPVLGSVLRSPLSYSPAERAEAAKALGRIDSNAGQKELLDAIEELVPTADPAKLARELPGPGFGALTTALGAIRVVDRKSVGTRGTQNQALERISRLEPPPEPPQDANDILAHRVATIRCAASRILAGATFDDPRLVNCDGSNGKIGALSRLAVIDRGELVGPRYSAWVGYARKKNPPAVRVEAIRMLAAHAEAEGITPIIAEALSDESIGVVTEAALLVASNPDRFFGKPSKSADPTPDPKITEALTAATKRKLPGDAIETIGAIARASGALKIQEALPWIQSLCADPNPTLRQQAKQALASFGGKPSCERSKEKQYSPAPELGRVVGKTRIEINSPVG